MPAKEMRAGRSEGSFPYRDALRRLHEVKQEERPDQLPFVVEIGSGEEQPSAP